MTIKHQYVIIYTQILQKVWDLLDGWKPMCSEILSQFFLLVFHVLLAGVSSLLFRVLRVTYGKTDCWAKTSRWIFSHVVLIQVIRSICSVISGIDAFQLAYVILQVSVRTLPVSLSVLICIFTCELQSKSSATLFNFSGYFFPIGFGVYTANF